MEGLSVILPSILRSEHGTIQPVKGGAPREFWGSLEPDDFGGEGGSVVFLASITCNASPRREACVTPMLSRLEPFDTAGRAPVHARMCQPGYEFPWETAVVGIS